MNRIRNAIHNLFLFLLGCILAFSLLELLLIFFPPFEIRFKPDRIILPVNKTYIINNEGKFTKIDKITLHTKNSLGFRGNPPPPNFGAYLTLITIGGSTTECFYLSDDKTWTHILGDKLAKAFKNVWINNAGLDGATTYRNIILMEDYVAKLKPKSVLFLVGMNDVGVGNIGKENPPQGHYFNGVSRFLRSLAYRSEVYALGQNIYRFFIAQRRGLHHQELNLREMPTIEKIPEETRKSTINMYKDKYLTFYQQRLTKLISISRENGIEPVLITQPVLYGKGIDESTGVNLEQIEIGENLNGKLMYEIVELYNDVTRRVGKTNQVLVIDLATEFPKDSRYYYDFLHYSNAGAEKAAEIIFKDLRSFLSQKFAEFQK